MTITNKELDFYVKHGWNVLFEGEAGIGKTAIVLETFKRNKLNYKYFSGPTLDAWVDFVGVPKEKTDENTGISYLDLVRPKEFANDEIEAIFIDEYNRAPSKVMNAVMELIQFRSINGKKFNNLKVIWAAINPENTNSDKKYNVKPIDPAQLDRFHIHIELPYKPDRNYFISKHGSLGKIAISWWYSLITDTKATISPRRLDYILDVFSKGGSIKHLLTKTKANYKQLEDLLKSDYLKKRLYKTIKDKNTEDIEWFNNPNNFSLIESLIEKGNESFRKKAYQLYNTENLNKVLDTQRKKGEKGIKEITNVIKYSVENNQELNKSFTSFCKINKINIQSNSDIENLNFTYSFFNKDIFKDSKVQNLEDVLNEYKVKVPKESFLSFARYYKLNFKFNEQGEIIDHYVFAVSNPPSIEECTRLISLALQDCHYLYSNKENLDFNLYIKYLESLCEVMYKCYIENKYFFNSPLSYDCVTPNAKYTANSDSDKLQQNESDLNKLFYLKTSKFRTNSILKRIHSNFNYVGSSPKTYDYSSKLNRPIQYYMTLINQSTLFNPMVGFLVLIHEGCLHNKQIAYKMHKILEYINENFFIKISVT